MANVPIEKLQKIIDYTFKDIALLEQAVTHSSYSFDHNKPNYERLEFLGDSILELLVTEFLFTNFFETEGTLSKYRAKIVSASSLAKVVKEWGIEKYILLGNSLSHIKKVSSSILSDIFESIVASIYLDGGLQSSKEFVIKTLLKSKEFVMETISKSYDYKTDLQEKLKDKCTSIVYTVVKKSGLAHKLEFTVELSINGEIKAQAKATNKKEAEQKCAKIALEKL